MTRSRRARPAEEGRDLADAIGDRFDSRLCRVVPRNGTDICRVIWPEPPHNSPSWPPRPRQLTTRSVRATSLACQGVALAYQGETGAARAAADAAVEAAAELGGLQAGVAYAALAVAALAAGDVATAQDATEAAWQHLSVLPAMAAVQRTVDARGRAGGRGSGRGPPLGRRRRLDDDRLVPGRWR